MKVLHCCLSAFYIDNYSYQENVLPRIHKNMGLEVKILASTETYSGKVNRTFTCASKYLTEEGIEITRVPYVSWLPSILSRKLRIYTGIQEYLIAFQPDVIFIHDCQFLSILGIKKYAESRNVTVYVDSHTDYVNSARSIISEYILHRLVYRICARSIMKVTKVFYATLPIRAEFLIDVYGIPEDCIVELPFGFDDDRHASFDRASIRECYRENLRFESDEVVFCLGGKIDRRKGIHLFLSAFRKFVENNPRARFKVVLFGHPDEDMEKEIGGFIKEDWIEYIGWISAKEIYKVFLCSDIVVFPGTHSVLWEEAVGLGLPCIFKRWKGIEHINLGGNCILLDETTENALHEVLVNLSIAPSSLHDMQLAAMKLGPAKFSYSKIARLALDLDC